jgi:hypothetical protein
MQLDSFLKITIFVGLLLIVTYSLIQKITTKDDKSTTSKEFFMFLLLGFFGGICVDILILKFPLYEYPKIALVINSSVYVLLFYSFPIIGAIMAVVLKGYLSRKSVR